MHHGPTVDGTWPNAHINFELPRWTRMVRAFFLFFYFFIAMVHLVVPAGLKSRKMIIIAGWWELVDGPYVLEWGAS